MQMCMPMLHNFYLCVDYEGIRIAGHMSVIGLAATRFNNALIKCRQAMKIAIYSSSQLVLML